MKFLTPINFTFPYKLVNPHFVPHCMLFNFGVYLLLISFLKLTLQCSDKWVRLLLDSYHDSFLIRKVCLVWKDFKWMFWTLFSLNSRSNKIYFIWSFLLHTNYKSIHRACSLGHLSFIVELLWFFQHFLSRFLKQVLS